jgi:hypothetical protein
MVHKPEYCMQMVYASWVSVVLLPRTMFPRQQVELAVILKTILWRWRCLNPFFPIVNDWCKREGGLRIDIEQSS